MCLSGKSSFSALSLFLKADINIFKAARCYSQRHSRNNRTRAFVDYVLATARAGNGGDGAVMFTSEFMREFCGPDGGNGGHGAHVVLRANNNVNSLSGIPAVMQGRSGEPGASKSCAGKSADHVYFDVPVGTVVHEVSETSNKLLGDLSTHGDFLVVARGGAGGRGNRAFLTNEQRAPDFAEKGGRGEERKVAIEMKLIADVGLIGMPNAGKSSLLQQLSRARPKVAAFPFTTLRPYLGMIELPDTRQISIADLPGIIEGAHANRGLGLAFLRHIERCRTLLFVVDLSSSNPDPTHQFELLRSELETYNPALVKMRSFAVVANKVDMAEAAGSPLTQLTEFCKTLNRNIPVVAVSAKYGTNIEALKDLIIDTFSKPDK